MARLTTPLSDTQLKNAKPKEKKYKLADGGGLFMQINPNGAKLWRLSYRIDGKAKEYAIGTYPNISDVLPIFQTSSPKDYAAV